MRSHAQHPDACGSLEVVAKLDWNGCAHYNWYAEHSNSDILEFDSLDLNLAFTRGSPLHGDVRLELYLCITRSNKPHLLQAVILELESEFQ